MDKINFCEAFTSGSGMHLSGLHFRQTPIARVVCAILSTLLLAAGCGRSPTEKTIDRVRHGYEAVDRHGDRIQQLSEPGQP
jgi:hypothetical protein